MTEQEARAVVTQAVAEGLVLKFPQADPSKMREAASQLVGAIVSEYLRCRMLTAKPEGTVN